MTIIWCMVPKIEHDRQNFLSFWTVFCHFTFLTIWKIKILKNWKKHTKISSFYTSVPKIMIKCCTAPEIWHVTDIIVIFHFGLFFALLTPKQPKKSKFKQNEKSSWRYNHFTYVPKIMIRWCTVPEIWCTTDGRTDRRTEKVTYRGGCPT